MTNPARELGEQRPEKPIDIIQTHTNRRVSDGRWDPSHQARKHGTGRK